MPDQQRNFFLFPFFLLPKQKRFQFKLQCDLILWPILNSSPHGGTANGQSWRRHLNIFDERYVCYGWWTDGQTLIQNYINYINFLMCAKCLSGSCKRFDKMNIPTSFGYRSLKRVLQIATCFRWQLHIITDIDYKFHTNPKNDSSTSFRMR